MRVATTWIGETYAEQSLVLRFLLKAGFAATLFLIYFSSANATTLHPAQNNPNAIERNSSTVRRLVSGTVIELFSLKGAALSLVRLNPNGSIERYNSGHLNFFRGQWSVDSEGRLLWEFINFPSSAWRTGWFHGDTALYSDSDSRAPAFRACVGRGNQNSIAFTSHYFESDDEFEVYQSHGRHCRAGGDLDWIESPNTASVNFTYRNFADTQARPDSDADTPDCSNNTTGAILALQDRLFQLGYDIGIADGEYGPKTHAAVEKFRKGTGLHGAPLCKLLAAARELTLPQRWIAVAFTANGRSKSSWNYASRRDAESRALAGWGGQRKVISLSGDNSCVALSFGRRGRAFGTFSVGLTGARSRAALTDAFAACQRDGLHCKHITMTCENGPE